MLETGRHHLQLGAAERPLAKRRSNLYTMVLTATGKEKEERRLQQLAEQEQEEEEDEDIGQGEL